MSSSAKIEKEVGTIASTKMSSLPSPHALHPDLINLVCSFLRLPEDRITLRSMMRSSRACHQAAGPILYKRITLNPLSPRSPLADLANLKVKAHNPKKPFKPSVSRKRRLLGYVEELIMHRHRTDWCNLEAKRMPTSMAIKVLRIHYNITPVQPSTHINRSIVRLGNGGAIIPSCAVVDRLHVGKLVIRDATPSLCNMDGSLMIPSTLNALKSVVIALVPGDHSVNYMDRSISGQTPQVNLERVVIIFWTNRPAVRWRPVSGPLTSRNDDQGIVTHSWLWFLIRDVAASIRQLQARRSILVNTGSFEKNRASLMWTEVEAQAKFEKEVSQQLKEFASDSKRKGSVKDIESSVEYMSMQEYFLREDWRGEFDAAEVEPWLMKTGQTE